MADAMPPPSVTEQTDDLSMSPEESADVKPRADSIASMTGSVLNAGLNNASRRPPRKSTLTQQQKNQKRQRATQDQLMTLEVEFNKNPTPTALVRERIAQEINMTERSVQIWFQNRRAKIKNIAKRSIESGEDCDSIPDSMRQYLAMQAFGQGGKGMGPGLLGRAGPGFTPYGAAGLCLNPDASSGKTLIQHFHCRSLSIGTWRRVGQSTMDLVIFYSPDKACMTYYINNEAAGYKIEYPFAWIKNITLEQGDVLAAAEGASQRSGGLIIELTRPPKFYMDSSGSASAGFYECGDFTEDQQASQVLTHHLGGPSKVLSGQLAKLVSLEAYQNRHHQFDPNVLVMSAPVSPIGIRPASQPNHMLHPHHAMNLYPPHDVGMGLMGPPGPRGHKRQRSRSVPVAIDFSMLRHPMPSFLIQQDGNPHPAPLQDPNIYAPVPQHQHPHAFVPGPNGANLSIDTSHGYPMPVPFAGSLSATTANSPSEYGAPHFFPPVTADGMHMPHFNPNFNNGFLAVDPASMIGTSNTPLSIASHGDPVIADHSPPLNGMGRSQSADIFGTPGENSQMGDESIYLSESFNKQIALPFRSPLSEDTFHSPMPDNVFNFQSPTASAPESQGGNVNMAGPPAQMNFQTPAHQTQDGTMYPSPQSQQVLHQDSAVSFSTPSHMSQEQAVYATPKEGHGLMYHDSKMFASPGQMHPGQPDEQMFHHPTPPTSQEMDLQAQMYGFVDPHALGQHQ